VEQGRAPRLLKCLLRRRSGGGRRIIYHGAIRTRYTARKSNDLARFVYLCSTTKLLALHSPRCITRGAGAGAPPASTESTGPR
jgi:hypothetical protein